MCLLWLLIPVKYINCKKYFMHEDYVKKVFLGAFTIITLLTFDMGLKLHNQVKDIFIMTQNIRLLYCLILCYFYNIFFFSFFSFFDTRYKYETIFYLLMFLFFFLKNILVLKSKFLCKHTGNYSFMMKLITFSNWMRFNSSFDSIWESDELHHKNSLQVYVHIKIGICYQEYL